MTKKMMNLLLLITLALFANAFADEIQVISPRSLQNKRDCSTTPIPPCARRGSRDIVFLVDASDSMLVDNFYGPMLDYVQTAFCAFDSADNNRAAMVTFAGQVVTRIPLAQYSAVQWFNQVDNVRADSSVCCSCCTPTAEAFRAARDILTNNPPIREDTIRVVLMISDGNPWQNTVGDFSTKRMGPSTYTYRTVPQQATLLKNLNGQKDSVRLLFLGAPDKWGNSPDFGFFKGTNIPGTKRCIKRRRKTECIKIAKPNIYYPVSSAPADKYVMVTDTWDLIELIEIVSDTLCRTLSDAPTQSPTKQPTSSAPTTARPTQQPTISPTESRRFDGLDLYLFLDRSRSMRWRHQDCKTAPGGSLSWSDATACWQLFLGFAQMMVIKASQLEIRTPGAGGPGTKIGWQSDYADKSKGLRVWIYGFACADSQSRPIVEHIGEKVSSLAEFNSKIDAARTILPDGGTCPGAAFERSLGMIMANDVLTRPFKAALLFTDGVFYDQPKPEAVAKGFAYFGVMTYALGIAIPQNGKNTEGLTASEIRDQKKQLKAFVNGDNERFVNFGANGYNILDSIAQGFIDRLPTDVETNYPRLLEKPYWCGFTSVDRCLNTNPEVFDSSAVCKWIPNNWDNFNGNGRCMDKTWCGWPTKQTCKQDRFCTWFGGKCMVATG